MSLKFLKQCVKKLQNLNLLLLHLKLKPLVLLQVQKVLQVNRVLQATNEIEETKVLLATKVLLDKKV